MTQVVGASVDTAAPAADTAHTHKGKKHKGATDVFSALFAARLARDPHQSTGDKHPTTKSQARTASAEGHPDTAPTKRGRSNEHHGPERAARRAAHTTAELAAATTPGPVQLLQADIRPASIPGKRQPDAFKLTHTADAAAATVQQPDDKRAHSKHTAEPVTPTTSTPAPRAAKPAAAADPGQPAAAPADSPKAGTPTPSSAHPARADRDRPAGEQPQTTPAAATVAEPRALRERPAAAADAALSTLASAGTDPSAQRVGSGFQLLVDQPRQTALARDVAGQASMLLERSVRNGDSRAQITLRPDHLGQLEIQLTHTSEGLHAVVTAESAEAARMLTEQIAQLERSLTDAGVQVAELDVRTQQEHADRRDQQQALAERIHGRRSRHDVTVAAADAPQAPQPPHRVRMGGGLTIDTLA